jgi:hypothetical protein
MTATISPIGLVEGCEEHEARVCQAHLQHRTKATEVAAACSFLHNCSCLAQYADPNQLHLMRQVITIAKQYQALCHADASGDAVQPGNMYIPSCFRRLGA